MTFLVLANFSPTTSLIALTPNSVTTTRLSTTLILLAKSPIAALSTVVLCKNAKTLSIATDPPILACYPIMMLSAIGLEVKKPIVSRIAEVAYASTIMMTTI